MSKIRYLGSDALRYFKDKFINKDVIIPELSENAEIIDVYTNKFIIINNKYVEVTNNNSKLNGYILIRDKTDNNIYRIDAYFSFDKIISNNTFIGDWIIEDDDNSLRMILNIPTNNGIVDIEKEYKKYILNDNVVKCLLYNEDDTIINKQLIYTKPGKKDYFYSIFKAKYIKIDKFTYIPIDYNDDDITSVILKCIDVDKYLVDCSIFDIKISCTYNDNVAIINSINSTYANNTK